MKTNKETPLRTRPPPAVTEASGSPLRQWFAQPDAGEGRPDQCRCCGSAHLERRLGLNFSMSAAVLLGFLAPPHFGAQAAKRSDLTRKISEAFVYFGANDFLQYLLFLHSLHSYIPLLNFPGK